MTELEKDLNDLREKANRLTRLNELAASQVDITINTTVGEVLQLLPTGVIFTIFSDGSWNMKSIQNEKYRLPSGTVHGSKTLKKE